LTSGFVGYVTRFEVEKAFIDRYEVQTVGSRSRQEYWIPAEDLPEFNASIVGLISVLESYPAEPGSPATS